MSGGVAPSWEPKFWFVMFWIVLPAKAYADYGWWGLPLLLVIYVTGWLLIVSAIRAFQCWREP